jgi:hypothetical protein
VGLIPLWAKALVAGAVLVVLVTACKGRDGQLRAEGAAAERATWIERDLNAAQDARKETQRRLERQEASHRETAQRAAAVAAALGRERRSAGQLRDELDAATAARRGADPAAVAQCAPAEADRDLHADLRGRADAAAGELAAEAARYRLAGETCEREHDALTGAKP